jgi:hypothetical protein
MFDTKTTENKLKVATEAGPRAKTDLLEKFTFSFDSLVFSLREDGNQMIHPVDGRSAYEAAQQRRESCCKHAGMRM